MFHNSVSVVPFVPLPLYGTNSTSLVMGMIDVSEWPVQKPPLSGYNNSVRSYVLSSVWEGGGGGEGDMEIVNLNYPPHPLVLPDNVGIHCDKIFTCNGNFDTTLTINREASTLTTGQPSNITPDAPIIMVEVATPAGWCCLWTTSGSLRCTSP